MNSKISDSGSFKWNIEHDMQSWIIFDIHWWRNILMQACSWIIRKELVGVLVHNGTVKKKFFVVALCRILYRGIFNILTRENIPSKKIGHPKPLLPDFTPGIIQLQWIVQILNGPNIFLSTCWIIHPSAVCHHLLLFS